VLERQVLERLVIDKVQLQLARDMGLRVDDGQLEQALQRIASGNKLSLSQFRAALEKDGITFASFREEIRAEMTIARVREREVESKIFISDGEIDNYLATVHPAWAAAGEEYQLAHILLRAPESASPEQIQKLRPRPSRYWTGCARARTLRSSRRPIPMHRTV
jgi:peptidyl-prolyl cis-trans isomerase SurA